MPGLITLLLFAKPSRAGHYNPSLKNPKNSQSHGRSTNQRFIEFCEQAVENLFPILGGWLQAATALAG